MGRGGTFYCRTCKTWTYLGYGSCGSWLDGARSLAEYDRIVARGDNGNLIKNRNMRACLMKHDGHDVSSYSEDWTYEKGGRVFMVGSYGTETTDPIVGNAEDGWTEEPAETEPS